VVSEYGEQVVNCVSLNPDGVKTGINEDLGPWVQAGKSLDFKLPVLIIANIYNSIDRYSGTLRWFCGMAH
jgi:hypothetical protein